MKQSLWGFASASGAGTWSSKSGSWEGKVARSGEAQTPVRMRQKLQGCLGLKLDSQLPTSLLVCDAGELQDKLVTLSHGEEGTWPWGQRSWPGDLAGSGGAACAPPQPVETPDLQWHVPVSASEHKETMAASFPPSESQTKFLFWPKPTVQGTEFWEM